MPAGKTKYSQLPIRIIIICVALLSLFFLKNPVFRYRHEIINVIASLLSKQKVQLVVPASLSEKDINIIWNGPEKGLEKSLRKDSGKWEQIPVYLGENSFSVFYNGRYIGSAGYYSESHFRFHNCRFIFSGKNNEVHFQFSVTGTDTYKNWNQVYHSGLSKYHGKSSGSLLEISGLPSVSRKEIDFILKDPDFKMITRPGTDTSIHNITGTMNGRMINVKTLKNHGQNSLVFNRKSFSVKLADSLDITAEDGSVKTLNSFLLISLSMDDHYFRNKLAFAILKKLGLADVFNTYTEVKINGRTQGVYLLVENPKTHIAYSLNGSCYVRPRYENSSFYEKKSWLNQILRKDKQRESAEISYKIINGKQTFENCLYRYNTIFNSIRNQKDKQIVNILETNMDLEQYLELMAFNYIFCNHDYTDELYWYTRTGDDRFRFVPWDFDDIFGSQPHEGWKLRNRELNDKLVFSGESELDRKIALDSLSYGKYLHVLSDVTGQLDSAALADIFRTSYSELLPYYRVPEIINCSKTDASGAIYDVSGLKDQMEGTYAFLIDRIRKTRDKINPPE